MEKQGKSRGLNGAQLKWIALVTMIVDHAGLMLAAGSGGWYWGMRLIGRLAFPLYCFLLAEGFVHTRNIGRYLARLGIFALVSEIPFNLLNRGTITDSSHQNVFFTLFLGLLALWGSMILQNRRQMPLAILWCMAMAGLAALFRTDYGWAGVVLVILIYRFREDGIMRAATGFATLLLGVSLFEITALLSFFLMNEYNGEPGSRRLKWLFYAAYPLHILILWGVKRLMG